MGRKEWPMGVEPEKAVVGVFDNHTAAANAVHALEAGGYPGGQIGYIMQDPHGKTVAVPHDNTITVHQQAAAAGMLEGGMIGGVLGAAVGCSKRNTRHVRALNYRRSL